MTKRIICPFDYTLTQVNRKKKKKKQKTKKKKRTANHITIYEVEKHFLDEFKAAITQG